MPLGRNLDLAPVCWPLRHLHLLPGFLFPPSSGVVQAIHKAFSRFSGGLDLEAIPPSQMPGDVTTKVPVSKFGQGFQPKFHGGEEFPIPIKSLTPTPDESSFLRRGEEPSVPCRKVADLEFLLRKNVRVLSSLDWLLTTLKEVSALPHQDPAVLEALWTHVRKCLAFSTDFSAGALISSVILRREGFLRSCDTAKVPKRTHTWATLRPPFARTSTALLGDATAVLRTTAREDRELELMSTLSARQAPSRQRSNQRQPTTRDTGSASFSRSARPNPQYSRHSRGRRGAAPRGARGSSHGPTAKQH